MKAMFNPRKWTVGVIWRAKPSALWIDVPMFTIYIPRGYLCHDCKGQGGWSCEAGDACWFDECETCNGKGVVRR